MQKSEKFSHILINFDDAHFTFSIVFVIIYEIVPNDDNTTAASSWEILNEAVKKAKKHLNYNEWMVEEDVLNGGDWKGKEKLTLLSRLIV